MFLDKIDAAQTHREIYIAIIKSALRKHGDKRAFATELGIPAAHLSNMLNPGLDTNEVDYAERGTTRKGFRRTPDPELAQRLIHLLRLEPEVRQSLWEHLEMVWAHEKAALIPYASQPWLMRHAIEDMLQDIGSAHVEATRTSSLEDARRKYRVIQRACKLMVMRIDPDPTRMSGKDPDLDANPLGFVQVCLFIHDVQCVLDRAYDGLAHAKYASQIMAACDPDKFIDRRDYFDHLLVNTAVAECLAYRNMGLHKEAEQASDRAEELVRDLGSGAARYWLPHIYMHRLKALVERPRFTLGEVDELLRWIEDTHERSTHAADSYWEAQLAETRARCYMRYGVRYQSQLRLKGAKELLQGMVEHLDRMVLGPVHKTRLLRTYASVQWHLGAGDAWRHYIEMALRIAILAGLDHQITQTREEYSLALQPILENIEVLNVGRTVF